MKSIMEEASSISKAIEKGWIRAGKPQSFSIKVLEQPEKNFFGFTKKPAKIALFFSEEQSLPVKSERREQAKPKKEFTQKKNIPKNNQENPVSHAKPMQVTPLSWNSEMIALTESWITYYLDTMNLPTSFNKSINGGILTITFDSPLSTNTNKEHVIYTNLAYLIMVALRNKLKKELKGYRIILKTA